MTSQLNVDTIVDKAGSGGTNVKVANNAVAVAEGGGATTNVVQGLTKQWCNMSGQSTPSFRNSFNSSSITDVGTGQHNIFLTNALDNADFVITGGKANQASNAGNATGIGVVSTSAYQVVTYENGSVVDVGQQYYSLNGDLA
jgi:hypothetical protein